MTELVMKPEPDSGVVNRKGLYRVHMNRKPIGLLFRAKNAAEADGMLQYLFENQTRGKTIDFDLAELKEVKDADEEKTDVAGTGGRTEDRPRA